MLAVNRGYITRGQINTGVVFGLKTLNTLAVEKPYAPAPGEEPIGLSGGRRAGFLVFQVRKPATWAIFA